MPSGPPTTRRGFLLAGGGGLVAAGAAAAAFERGPLKRTYQRLSGACGDAGSAPPRSAARVTRGTMPTAHLPGGRTDFRIAYPPGHHPGHEPDVLVFLHGRGGTAADATEGLRLQDVAAQDRAARPLAVVSVSGGDGYWHRRADGRDPLALLLDEFLPACERRLGAGGRRVLMGVSMGGYGAALAGLTEPGRFAGVVVSSGAFWTSRAEQQASVPDAFDSRADFEANDVVAAARRGAFSDLPVAVWCGTADPFERANRAFAAAVGGFNAGTFEAGCHERRTWSRWAPDQVAAARDMIDRDAG